MSANSFDPKKATQNELRIQLEVAKERLGHRENEIIQLKKELENSYKDFKQQGMELRKVVEEMNELKMQLEISRERLEHKEKNLDLKEGRASKQKVVTKLQSFFASSLFLLATLLASFGTNMLTSAPPDSKGYMLVILACIAYLLAAFMTIFILGEGVTQ